jgi:hypothetical protein
MRPEIEEDYRQLKDFRELEDLKSTKLSLVAFHIYAVLPADIRLQLDGILSLV